MNLGLLLDMVASALPNRPAVTHDGETLDFQGLHDAAARTARRIVASGADGLVYCGTNDRTVPVALFGAALAGVPFIPLNYRLGTEQLQPMLDAHPNALVVGDRDALAGHVAALTDRTELLRAESTWDDTELPGFIDPETVAVQLYTSGTSGTPKAALLRHRHLAAYLIGTVECASADERDAALVSVPPYHVAGMANLLSNVYAGRRLVYLDAFTAETWLDTARDEKVTQAMVVPTMLARIVSHLDGAPADVPSLRTLSYGGSRTALPVIEAALAAFPDTGFVNAYGLTETSSTIALLGPDTHEAARSGDPEALRRLTSVGQLLPGIEVEVRDEDGTVVPEGTPGLVFLRGEQVSGEYATGSVLDADGWFPTRDRGWVEDGYLFIEGRADDTIIRGGENIAPAEIEDVLARHPDVAEVAVLGLPDDEWGQRVAAVVVPVAGTDPDPGSLADFAREHLRGSKTPEVFEFRDELPRTPTGKVLRRELLAELSSDA